MLQAGNEDRGLLEEIELLARELSFSRKKDREILMDFVSRLSEPPLNLSSALDPIHRGDQPIKVYSPQNHEALRDYGAILESLKDMKAYFKEGNEDAARSKLHRLTGTLPLSVQVFAGTIILALVTGLLWNFYLKPAEPEISDDPLNQIKRVFETK